MHLSASSRANASRRFVLAWKNKATGEEGKGRHPLAHYQIANLRRHLARVEPEVRYWVVPVRGG